jgi:hypothetical protein
VNGNSHLLEASQGERVRQAEVESTRAAMQRAVDVPRLDTLSMTELACSGKVTVLALKGESRLGAEPVKPCRRIGNQGQHANAWEK